MLWGKFLNIFPLYAEVYGSYFQARINLKVLFSSSRYATFALRYSSSSGGPMPTRSFSFFFRPFLCGTNPSTHSFFTFLFHRFKESLGRDDCNIHSGNENDRKISLGVMYWEEERWSIFCFPSSVKERYLLVHEEIYGCARSSCIWDAE